MIVLIICGCLVMASISSAVSPSQGADSSAVRLFELYDRAEYAAIEKILRVTDHDVLRKRFDKAAREWIAANPALSDRRSAVVAMVALEAAAARFEQWSVSREVLEAGCKVLRSRGTRDFDRHWHIAATALAEGAYDRTLVLDHLNHVPDGVKRDPRLQLARAVNAELGTWPGSKQPVAIDESEARQRAERAFARGWIPMHRDILAHRMFGLLEPFQGLTADRTVGAEASLRLGHTYYRIGRIAEALEILKHAEERAEDEFVLYLARYFRARAHEYSGKREEATAAYRQALQVVPNAQSASFPLATLLFTAGHRSEAAAIIERALRDPIAPDPWRHYQQGGFRSIPHLIIAAREEIR